MESAIENFFANPQHATQKRYEVLRSFFYEKKTVAQIAKQYNYTTSSIYSLTTDFRQWFKNSIAEDYFFIAHKSGRKQKNQEDGTYNLIIELRKKYLSVPDIKSILDSQNHKISEKYIYNIIRKEGFARLPRRSNETKNTSMNLAGTKFAATKSFLLNNVKESISVGDSIGILCLLPYIENFGIDKIIEKSGYPSTKTLPALNSILSFVAIKLSNVRRYTSDDIWCMNRGLGLFAGLNVLPKAAWFTSYSHRVTREMNIKFLKNLNKLWADKKWLSDTANLDFTTLPYWGDASHLENNWSGTRHKALESILAALAQDPDTGIITYGDTNVRHNNESAVVVEFLDFYKENNADNLKYLVFDSKFTTYQNLARLNDQKIKFITIRRRGKSIVESLNKLPSDAWSKVRVPTASGRTRQLKIIDKTVYLKDYGKEIRQIAITGHGKIKPALIITNDFDLNVEYIIRKYAKRWLVEKEISEQIEFFHLNKLSSSMVIKIDFDFTMTILAHNLLRLFAADLVGYNHSEAVTLYEKFLHNSGFVDLNEESITVSLKKKRNLPLILTAMNKFEDYKITWLHNRKIRFVGSSTS